MAREIASFIEEANGYEILEHYDNGQDDEWPEESDENESSSEHRDGFSIA